MTGRQILDLDENGTGGTKHFNNLAPLWVRIKAWNIQPRGVNLFRIPGAQDKSQFVVLACVSDVMITAPALPTFIIQIDGQLLGNWSQIHVTVSLFNLAKP